VVVSRSHHKEYHNDVHFDTTAELTTTHSSILSLKTSTDPAASSKCGNRHQLIKQMHMAETKNKFTEVEKFNLLRSISITVAGIKANMKPKTSKEELETLTLSFCIERVELDLKTHSGGNAANLTLEIMKKRKLKTNKKLSKRMKGAIEKVEVKAAKKNVAAADPTNFSGLECHELFLEIKAEANNTFNPIWVKNLNKDGTIPSGVQTRLERRHLL
jgi:hypothetical protein